MFADTCSIEAAISLTDETSSSLEAGSRLGLAGRVDERCHDVIHVAERAHRACAVEAPRPSATSSAMRAMPAADAVTCSARLRIAAVSIRGAVRSAVRLRWTVVMVKPCLSLQYQAATSGSENSSRFARFKTRMRRPFTEAMPSTYWLLKPASESCGGVMAASGSRRNSRPSSAMRPDAAAARA